MTQQSGCAVTLGSNQQAFTPSGGAGSVRVDASVGCQWQATSNVSWITIQSGASGSGAGEVRFQVAANTGAARTGALTIGNRAFTVTQDVGCSFVLTAGSANVPAAGGGGTVGVTAPPGCVWSASAPGVSWARITAGANGNGDGKVEFAVDPNTGPARSTTMTIAGHTFTIQQAGNCTVGIAPTSQMIGTGGGTGTIAVTAGAGCTWTATPDPNASWVRITAGASGSGDGRVDFSVDPNGGPVRSATLMVNNLPFAIQQSGGCTFNISPTGQTFPGAGGAGTIAVTSSGGCTWTATSPAPWITINSAGSSGSGPGSVEFSVAPNPGIARTGTIAVAGQTFTVEQASGCAFTIAPGGQAFDVAGGSGTIAITTNDGCTWSASSPEAWVTFTSPANGSGSGSVTFAVESNTGASRVITLTIAGQPFTVTQAGTMVMLESLIVRDTPYVPIVQRPRT